MNQSGAGLRHVFLCADANYVVPLAVALRSLAETQADPSSYHVTVLSAGIPPGEEDRLRLSVPSLSLRFVPIEQLLPPHIPSVNTQFQHLNNAVYGRLFGVDILPRGVERALYLDADLIATTDLGFLFSFDLDGAPIAAIQSPTIPHVSSPWGLSQWRDLNMPPQTPYMNSGVLVIDVEAWVARDLGRAVIEFVRANQDYLSLGDQDGFNGVLAGDWARLPLRWNQESTLRQPNHRAYSFFAQDEVDEAIEDPAIVHFTGASKPWDHHCDDPASSQWLELLQRTEYRDYEPPFPPTPPLRRRAARRFKRLIRV